MNWNRVVAGVLGLMLVAAWTGCETPAPPPYICQSDEIRVGDNLSVAFILSGSITVGPGVDSGDKEFQVRDDGTINMPLIGPTKAAGKKFAQLEKELQQMYVPKYYTRLTIVIKPRDRSYTVGGEVKQPGRQIYIGETTVLRAITSCGDFTEFANRRKVEIIRANGTQEIVNCNEARKNPTKYDRPICPGDAIYVPRSL